MPTTRSQVHTAPRCPLRSTRINVQHAVIINFDQSRRQTRLRMAATYNAAMPATNKQLGRG
eukprot:6189786-Pleurochrysis_carterae.AAC.3